MHSMGGFCAAGRGWIWSLGAYPLDTRRGVRVSFRIGTKETEALAQFVSGLKEYPIDWLTPPVSRTGKWIVDLSILREFLKDHWDLSSHKWFSGRVSIRPELTDKTEFKNGRLWVDTEIAFVFAEENVATAICTADFRELDLYLERFKERHAIPRRTAFVIMRFESTKPHQRIYDCIKNTLSNFDIVAVRADEHSFSEDLFLNVRTYMHGCAFGIAVFDRITREDFNPNIALEVGYMMALGKPVCLLKDRTLASLHSDLVGRLYRSFDPHDPDSSIQAALEPWLREKEFVI